MRLFFWWNACSDKPTFNQIFISYIIRPPQKGISLLIPISAKPICWSVDHIGCNFKKIVWYDAFALFRNLYREISLIWQNCFCTIWTAVFNLTLTGILAALRLSWEGAYLPYIWIRESYCHITVKTLMFLILKHFCKSL